MHSRRIEGASRSGAENMALDQALLDEAERTGRTFLRLYRFDPPCISFGRNEPARERYDPDAIARRGIDVVRRPTGGRAVWHQHEVTYAVAAPVTAFGTLREAYRAIHARLVAALRFLGADVTLAPHRPRPPSTALDRVNSCFAAPVGGEVLIAGRKVIGSAQVRQGGALLQHGSILLARSPYTPMLPGISELSHRNVTAAQACEATETQFSLRTGWQLVPGGWTTAEQNCISHLATTKYGHDHWNRKR